MSRFLLGLFLLVLTALGPASGVAQEIGLPGAYVTWAATAAPAEAAPGTSVQLMLRAEVALPWKMYALDASLPEVTGPRPRGLRITLPDLPAGLSEAGPAWQTDPKEGYDPNFKLDLKYFQETAEIGLPLALSTSLAPGRYEVAGQVAYQICNDDLGVCLPPARAPFATVLTVAGAPVAAAAPPGATPAPGALGEGNVLAGVGEAALDTGGQVPGLPTTYVNWTAAPRPAVVPPGSAVAVVLQAEVAPPWKLYALDALQPVQTGFKRPRGLRVTLEAPPEVLTPAGPAWQAPPQSGYDANFEIEVHYFKRAVEVGQTYTVAADAAPGRYDVAGTVTFQICNEESGICLPPTPVPFATAVAVDPGAMATTVAALAPPPSETTVQAAPDDLALARAGGMWGFLLLAIGAGLATLLTPCVFPMIPLTVSYFTRHADDRGEAVRQASVYGLSIVGTFTALGLLMALVMGAAGAQTIATNPWVNLFIALVLVVFGLSLLGLFELRMPQAMLNYANKQGTERGGYGGVVFMGLTLTLVSFSCTAPFVGGLLAAAAGGTWVYPLLGMVAFSATFALPFVVFALFPNALNALPKSGSWMTAVKVTLGFVELAAALKFLSNADLVWQWGLVSRPLAIAVTVVLFFLTGLFLIGKLRLTHTGPVVEVGVVRLLFAVLFFGTSLYMLPGLLGAPLNSLDAYLPPRQATDVSLLALFPPGTAGGGVAAAHEADWVTDDVEAALALAQQQNKPVFIDFTGYTCTNCRQMEANIFPRPAVAERFDRFVLLRLYTDGPEHGPALLQYQLDLVKTVALPTYAIVDPAGQLLQRVVGMQDEDEFVAFLDAGAAQYQQLLAAR